MVSYQDKIDIRLHIQVWPSSLQLIINHDISGFYSVTSSTFPAKTSWMTSVWGCFSTLFPDPDMHFYHHTWDILLDNFLLQYTNFNLHISSFNQHYHKYSFSTQQYIAFHSFIIHISSMKTLPQKIATNTGQNIIFIFLAWKHEQQERNICSS